MPECLFFSQILGAYHLIEPQNLLLYFEVPFRDLLKELFNKKIIGTKQAKNTVKLNHQNEPVNNMPRKIRKEQVNRSNSSRPLYLSLGQLQSSSENYWDKCCTFGFLHGTCNGTVWTIHSLISLFLNKSNKDLLKHSLEGLWIVALTQTEL